MPASTYKLGVPASTYKEGVPASTYKEGVPCAYVYVRQALGPINQQGTESVEHC